LLYVAANYPGIFKSIIEGGGATDPKDIGDILYELVNAHSPEYYKDMTGEQSVRGAIDTMKGYSIADFVLQDYLASYAGDRFRQSVEFVRHYPCGLARLAGILPASPSHVRSLLAVMIRMPRFPTRGGCTGACTEVGWTYSIAVTLRGKSEQHSMANWSPTGSEATMH
jgi:hypothetical protein